MVIMMRQPNETLNVYDLTSFQVKASNLLFRKLYDKKDIDMRSARKILSGIKMKRAESKRLLKKLHKLGLISIIHGKVRLASIGLYYDILDEDNKKLVDGLSQKGT